MLGSMNRALILVNATPDEPIILDRGGWGPEEPVEGVDITRPICRCHFAGEGSQLGEGCSKPTSGGSGSAEFGAGDNTAKAGPGLGTIAVVGVVGLGALYFLGII